MAVANYKSSTHTRFAKSRKNPFSWTLEILSSILGHKDQVVPISSFPLKNPKRFKAQILDSQDTVARFLWNWFLDSLNACVGVSFNKVAGLQASNIANTEHFLSKEFCRYAHVAS